ncbi:hypothetical protein LTR70_002957 [Exophiala xenobiotica]|uniref:DSBA-like thioredoxin domain-containing protein n=1 Tax=Lithohypha guttulata TaxID=1690604 RepID=A0ABR0K5S4_9EURO|nr:hypothetical protein LTR24_006510 [Lithohypha guttulata]KAK5324327.1 hypothetical protein LTR70_002957 [Exophiala xenobiotica]
MTSYESQISFTLDTICPWTYLAKKRLDEALKQFRASEHAKDVQFTVKYLPFLLYPEASKEGEDKYEWYRKSRYGDSEEKMRMYETLMSAYGTSVGIKFKFHGTVANTLDSHRVIQHFQEEKGPETANKLINSLYSQYFENERHPSSDETLLKATAAAGIAEDEAKAFIEDRDEGIMDTKMAIGEQRGNTDAVPYIIFEGKRRDFTQEGLKEIEEYYKSLVQVAKESK